MTLIIVFNKRMPIAREHAISRGHLNVMLEIRNDLIATDNQQNTVAKMIAKWIDRACSRLGVPGDVQCRA